MDTAAYRLNAFAFPIWTFALIAGAIWAQHAWGRFWGWDPKEVWMFITWVVYAGYLHARATPGWRRRLPWIGVDRLRHDAVQPRGRERVHHRACTPMPASDVPAGGHTDGQTVLSDD